MIGHGQHLPPAHREGFPSASALRGHALEHCERRLKPTVNGHVVVRHVASAVIVRVPNTKVQRVVRGHTDVD